MNTHPLILTLIDCWSKVLRKASFRYEFLGTLISLYGLMAFSQLFFASMEKRQGTVLYDPILSFLPSLNMSWLIFPLIYCSILLAIWKLSFTPDLLVKTLQAYFLLTVFRLTLIYLVPLNPPEGMVLLRDPLIDYFIYDENIITKDLFFSGHTSSLFLFYIALKEKYLKMLLLVCTILVGGLILVQHAHYSVDVFAAPLFANFAWQCIRVFNKFRINHNQT